MRAGGIKSLRISVTNHKLESKQHGYVTTLTSSFDKVNVNNIHHYTKYIFPYYFCTHRISQTSMYALSSFVKQLSTNVHNIGGVGALEARPKAVPMSLRALRIRLPNVTRGCATERSV